MRSLLLQIVKIIPALLIVTTIAKTSLSNSNINQDSLIQEINELGKKLEKLQSRNYMRYKRFDNFIKEYNNELHSQQYLNDSLFEQVLLIRNDINANIKELKKFNRNIHYLSNVDTNQDQNNNTWFMIITIFLSLIYLLTTLFLILSRRNSNRHIKQSDEENKKQYADVDKKLDVLSKQLFDKIEGNRKSIVESNDQTSKELMKKIIDHKEYVDGVIRSLNSQIEDKFK